MAANKAPRLLVLSHVLPLPELPVSSSGCAMLRKRRESAFTSGSQPRLIWLVSRARSCCRVACPRRKFLLEHEHDALLVPPDDPESMAAAMCRILTESGLAARLSRNARATAEGFDGAVVLPQWEAVLAAVAEGAKP